ncbi:MAG: alpha/beta hydrolase [Methanobacterium paludis]|nr:alpha/beta hydrolase [Methanobacterium paludis]
MKKNLKIISLVILVILTAFVRALFNTAQNQANTTSNVAYNSNVNPIQSWTNAVYAHVSAAEKMDVYLPNSTGPYPVIIVIHGGAFKVGDKNGQELRSIKQPALNRGYAVVSINYRLSSEAKFPAQINDVKAAIRYIRANSYQYDINPNKIAVYGSSAGGYLAALAGTSGDVIELQDPNLGNSNVSDKVQAVVDLYGPINFSTIDEQFKESGISGKTHNSSSSPESLLMGKNIASIPDQVAKANPETYISKEDPAFFIQHGSVDKLVPYQQSIDFANKLKSVIGNEKVYIEIIQGAGHIDPQFTTTDNIKKILDFLDTNLNQS